jgi:hypothetical protein
MIIVFWIVAVLYLHSDVSENMCLHLHNLSELLIHLLMLSLLWPSETSDHKTNGVAIQKAAMKNLKSYVKNFRNVRIRPRNNTTPKSKIHIAVFIITAVET